MSVTVYFPPYFVGLKMSDWIVAIAVTQVSAYVACSRKAM